MKVKIEEIAMCDPYKGFDHTKYALDLQPQWGGTSPIIKELVKTVKPELIIEVGSWKGQSAITMAETMKEIKINGKIICVDTWLGGFKSRLIPEYAEALKCRNGYPQVYYQFLANVIKAGFEKTIIPLALSSDGGAEVLQRKKVQAELIYIDAGHTFEGTMSELRNFYPLLKKGGVIFGHDYNWSSVRQAVITFSAILKAQGLPYKIKAFGDELVYGDNNKFWVIGLEDEDKPCKN